MVEESKARTGFVMRAALRSKDYDLILRVVRLAEPKYGECSWLGIGKKTADGRWEIVRVEWPEQKNSAGASDMDDMAIADLTAKLAEGERIIWWGHSHGTGGTYFSTKDETQWKIWADAQPEFFFASVHNTKNECYFRAITSGVVVQADHFPIALVGDSERDEEANAIIEKCMTRPVAGHYSGLGKYGYYGHLTGDFEEDDWERAVAKAATRKSKKKGGKGKAAMPYRTTSNLRDAEKYLTDVEPVLFRCHSSLDAIRLASLGQIMGYGATRHKNAPDKKALLALFWHTVSDMPYVIVLDHYALNTFALLAVLAGYHHDYPADEKESGAKGRKIAEVISNVASGKTVLSWDSAPFTDDLCTHDERIAAAAMALSDCANRQSTSIFMRTFFSSRPEDPHRMYYPDWLGFPVSQTQMATKGVHLKLTPDDYLAKYIKAWETRDYSFWTGQQYAAKDLWSRVHFSPGIMDLFLEYIEQETPVVVDADGVITEAI